MRVSHVALDDFRSYRHAVIELPAGTTVLVGPNGQGKTNLVEAIAYLSAFTSHRVAAEGAMVRADPDVPPDQAPGGAVIRVKLVTRERARVGEGPPGAPAREQVLELEIVRGRANRARLNRTTVRPRDIVGMVRTVVFAPEDIQLVRGDPAARRQFLDDLATQLHPTLSVVRADFDRVARQRGALMRQASHQIRRGRAPDLSTLDVWDEQFAQLSSRMTAARAEVVDLIAGPAARAYLRVSDSPKALTMRLDASVDRVDGSGAGGDPQDVDGQAARLLQVLEDQRGREAERGVNLVGAHRDDLDLGLGGMPVKGYASHGETWSVALAARLAAFSVLEDQGEEPILILDDVFSELDTARRRGLAEMVAGADQVLVTAAVAEDVPEALRGHRLDVSWEAGNGSVVSSQRDVRADVEGEVGDES
ncbi:DNA replication/repair protein RecF [Schaalia naturae]|uniref:DNA replication and repair protein RecF n=1 Tax=Schaalia naturae TaxID=635203 RepID=A0ABW2SPL2_9ACTO